MKLSTACKSHDYRSIKIAKRWSKEGTCRVVSSTELDLVLPPIKTKGVILVHNEGPFIEAKVIDGFVNLLKAFEVVSGGDSKITLI